MTNARRVLVTGGTGFISCHALPVLLAARSYNQKLL
jgi:hypothetical protein